MQGVDQSDSQHQKIRIKKKRNAHLELVVEPLPGAFVRVRDRHRVPLREGLEAVYEQRDARLKEGQHRVAEVEALLHRQAALPLTRGVPDSKRGSTASPK